VREAEEAEEAGQEEREAWEASAVKDWDTTVLSAGRIDIRRDRPDTRMDSFDTGTGKFDR